MSRSTLRVGIAGCGYAARVHLDRLLAIEAVDVVGFADPDVSAAEAMVALRGSGAAFSDHRDLIKQAHPHALAIFTPHVAHYRPAMDALQAGCHVFVEKPLSTNVQEAVDIVGLARGRGRKVGVGHQYRLRPSLVEARKRIADGTIGAVRMVTATLAQPWLVAHAGAEHSWRFDPRIAGAGILADAGDHLLDALLWTTGQVAAEVAAVQSRLESGLDVVTAAAIRLSDGTPCTLAVSGVSPGAVFELGYYGERGRLRVTDTTLEEESEGNPRRELTLSDPTETIDGNFVAAILGDAPLCCPAEEALATVRLLEAIVRSATTAQVIRLA